MAGIVDMVKDLYGNLKFRLLVMALLAALLVKLGLAGPLAEQVSTLFDYVIAALVGAGAAQAGAAKERVTNGNGEGKPDA